jgi:diaminohydroxyphosphoribosylaminopyrimidine deaminase / 5-amino-6-(5-phosphoribosylamino)uracil reductase
LLCVAYICGLKGHEKYMSRCLQLALKGVGTVAPNPMVGSVLVYNEVIIGEGFTQPYGQAHAEVICLQSVKEENKHLINKSTLYVSLEPCAHYGKTPPCTDLIIAMQIPKVVIACVDIFANVNGKGIKKLVDAGIEVEVGILEKEAIEINKRFFTFHQKKRPYIILKWAQSSDKKIANFSDNRTFITNEYTNRLVHKWRSEEAAIMVGSNTALKDNPALTNRLFFGKSPTRIIIDRQLKLPTTLQIFDGQQKTIIFNEIKNEGNENLMYCKIDTNVNEIQQILTTLHQLNIQSILVEGGAKLLNLFLQENLWDEARVITNSNLTIGQGLDAPKLVDAICIKNEKILTDTIDFFELKIN